MTFGDALVTLKIGEGAARKGWNGVDMSIWLQVPDEKSYMTEPYIYMTPAPGVRIPWLASQADMLADDWERVQ